MSTAKEFDIRDYDFLFEEELDAPEADIPREPETYYKGTHVAPSAKQMAGRNIQQARQTVTDTARKAQEKGSELWKSTENVRKNTARAAKEKSAQLWDSMVDARENDRQTTNNFQHFKEDKKMETIKEKIGSICAGRISRGKYFRLTVLVALAGWFVQFMMAGGKTGFITILITVVCEIYTIIMTVKRLHDIGYKGTLSLLMLVPGAGEFFLLYLCLKRGQIGSNIYGPDPMM